MSLQQVHLRINDAATGKPTPVRLRVTDAAGNYYPPHGHAAEFPTGVGEYVGGDLLLDGKRWAYIDGSCEIALPPGELVIEATKGPNYRPLREIVILPVGKLALRFSIDCPVDWRRGRLFSGDTRAHFMTPHAALLEAEAEDLAVVNLLAKESPFRGEDGQTYMVRSNLHAFSGQRPCLEADIHLVAVNTLNTHPVLGKLALLNCHRTIHPLSFGGSDQSDDWSLADWCSQCHRKSGLVVWADAFGSKVGHAGEALANAILGDIDALELDPHDPSRVRAWYHLLNSGVRLPIVGGSGKDSNRTPLGIVRTYAHLQNNNSLPYSAWIEAVRRTFSYSAWIEAVRGGRTFVTTGPIPTLHLQGQGEGTVHYRAPGATLFRIHFLAYSLEPIERIEVLANGAVIATGDGKEVFLDVDLPTGGWLAARCWQGGRIVAHTSPQYVHVSDISPPVDSAAVAFLDGHLTRARSWVENEGRFQKPKSREKLLGIFDAARDKLNASALRR
jgi:hypothetical protein